jgi:hypothetical protein
MLDFMSAAAEVITETGGFCVGRNRLLALNGSWPFGTLEIHSDRLVLDTLFRRYTFPRDNIVSLSISSRFFSRGLRIEHRIPEYPHFIAFWSFHISRVRQRLLDAGYLVHDTQI